MDITIYLPDALGQQAKDREYPLSQMLRAAVAERIEQEDAMQATLTDAKEYRLDLEDGTVGRLTGTLIAEARGVEAYLTADERVLVYDGDNQRVSTVEDPENELRGWFPHDPEEYASAMGSLGLVPVIDL